MAKIKYYYNTETCEYEKARVTLKSTLSLIATYFIYSIVGASFILSTLFYFFDSPKEKLLREQNRLLISQLESFNNQLTAMEQNLDAVHDRDNELYRSILSAEPISPTVWNGGTGGSLNRNELSPDILKETARKLDKMNYKLNLQSKSFNNISEAAANMKDELKHIPAIRPVAGDMISGYGTRLHPIHRVNRLHTGIDFRANINTPVIATGDGIVRVAGVKENGYGIHIDIDHGYGYVTKYAHLNTVTVRVGQKVKRGDVIGYTGNSGLSKGPHLHYEIEKNGVKINPIDYFYSDLTPEQYIVFRQQADLNTESMD